MSYMYTIRLNSLYDRFGMNPESTISELCTKERYSLLSQKENFTYAHQLTIDNYIVCNITNREVENQ